MRVAQLSHLASATAPTGAERSLALLALALFARGHEVAVATPGPWALSDELKAAGVSVTPLPVRPCWLVQYGPQPLWRQVARGVRYAFPDSGGRRLRAWLSELAPDVVHVNCLPHLRGAAAARSLGLPVVWHIREMLPSGRRRRWFAHRLRADATRIVAVSERRTKRDWALFVEQIAERYESAERITLVMDNLNTHTPGALYEAFPPEKANALWNRFSFVYTPKHGSWLNMAEIELNVLSAQCLNRRIDDIKVVRREVYAWQDHRNNKNARVNWQFTTEDARIKLKRLYPTLDG